MRPAFFVETPDRFVRGISRTHYPDYWQIIFAAMSYQEFHRASELEYSARARKGMSRQREA